MVDMDKKLKDKMANMQSVNREKSLARIKELTEQHKKAVRSGLKTEDDPGASSDDEEMK